MESSQSVPEAFSTKALDACKQEKLQNEKLRLLLSDCEESILRLQRQSTASRRLRELYRAIEEEKTVLHDFERCFQYEHTRLYDASRYVQECGLEMVASQLVTPEMKPQLESLMRVSQSLHAMRGSIASTGNLVNSSSPSSTMASTHIMESIHRYVDKCITLLKDSKLDSLRWSPMLDPICVLLYDVAKQPVISDCLYDIEEQCRRFKFDVEELSEQQRQAVSEGDMRHAEELYYQQLAVLESYSTFQSKKIERLALEEVSAFKEPLTRVHDVHKRCSTDVAALIREYEDLKQLAEKDLFRLHAVRERRHGEDYTLRQQFIAARDMSNHTLRENLQRQEAALQRIDAAEKELTQLSIERTEELGRRRRLIEAEEQRRRDVIHFQTFATEQTVRLEDTIHNCEVAEEVTDTIDEAISNACKDLEQYLRKLECDLESLRQEVHLGNLEGFRGFYLTLGDLLYKKERNVEELDKKIQMAHMQQELAMETLNPKAKEYSQMKKDLIKIREEMGHQIAALRDRQVLCIEDCRPTEDALRIAGIPFVRPEDELAEKNRARDLKLLEYHELMASEAPAAKKSVPGGDKSEILPPTDEELMREQEELERLRATIQPRKPNTASVSTRSLYKTM